MGYQPPAHGFRTFVFLWLTQSISVFGSALTLFVIMIWLTQELFPRPEQQPQLALAISLVSLAQSVPIVLAAPLAGSWVDHNDRKRTMAAMDMAKGVLSLLLMILLLNSALTLPLVLIIITLSTIFGAFHYAAFDTSYAMIVPEQHLPRANGMMQAMLDLSRVLAPMAAAAIIALPELARQQRLPGAMIDALAGFDNGMALAIGIDAATFFLAGAALVFLTIPSPRAVSAAAGALHTLRADVQIGIDFVRAHPAFLWLLLSFTVANLLGSPLFLFQPLLVKYNLASDWAARGLTYTQALAWLNTAAAAGGVLGGVVVSLWGGLKRRRVFGVLIPMIIAAAGEILYGASSTLVWSAALIFVISAMVTLMNPHSKSIWQTHTPREIQGRVLAMLRVIAQFTWPAGTLLAGLAAGVLNPGWLLMVLGVLFLAFSIAQLFNRALLRIEG